jgi:hypothetical protein
MKLADRQMLPIPNTTFSSAGHDMSNRATSIRILFLAAHLTAVVLLSAYSAGLISSLTMDNKNLPFRTFEELLNTHSYTAGVVNSSAATGFFSVRRNSVISSGFLPVPQAPKSAVILSRKPDEAVLVLRLMALLTRRIA